MYKILTKEEYYNDTKFISFSGINTFSKCETLFRDTYITKTYQEPEHDYFVYGKLVDAMVTEPADFVAQNFVLVDKRVKPEDALRYENEIKTLESEIAEKQEKADAGNKTAMKGVESRGKKIDELKEKLRVIRDIDGKTQVTRALWIDAEETALAIKTHAYYKTLEFNQFTSQQIIVTNVRGIVRKGRLDHLKLCPQIERLYKLYVANQITYEQMVEKIKQLNPDDLWAVITDIKTCADMEKLEPYNNHYRGQLGFYQDLVHNFFFIPIEKIKCQILAGDKKSNRFKMAELFSYTQAAIDDIKKDVEDWVKKWKNAVETNTFVSSKAKFSMKQDCFTCMECSQAPFSLVPGQPVLISEPRFARNSNNTTIVASIGNDELDDENN